RWQQGQQGAHKLQLLSIPATPERFHSVTSSPSYTTQPSARSPNAGIIQGYDAPTVSRYLWETTGPIAQWKRDAYGRMSWAIGCAIILSVMTVGSSFGLDFATPSVGLGCRSSGVLLYWMVSYIILIVMILSALISDLWSVREAQIHQYRTQESSLRKVLYGLLGTIAVTLRLFGKLLAFLNS
ncbi:hypothetical protein FRC20_005252, partial [Serendipita sp. 405]